MIHGMASTGGHLAARISVVLLLLSFEACSAPLAELPTRSVLPSASAGSPTAWPTPPWQGQPDVPEKQSTQDRPAAPPLTARGNLEEADASPAVAGFAKDRDETDGLNDNADQLWDRLDADIDLVRADYHHYYSCLNLSELGLGIALAAPLANTSADQHIRNWYQKRVRGETTDEFANVFIYGSQLWLALPIGLEAAALAGQADEDYASAGGLFEWSNRSLRSVAVGAPPMLFLYVALGASRPDRGNSHWHPFQDIHGVSGHTFFGAVPFLTAAEMTDNEYIKIPLVLGSFLTGWARINNDRHYFSQVALGWWLAYLAVRRVNDTQVERRPFSLVPACSEGPGLGVLVQY